MHWLENRGGPGSGAVSANYYARNFIYHRRRGCSLVDYHKQPLAPD